MKRLRKTLIKGYIKITQRLKEALEYLFEFLLFNSLKFVFLRPSNGSFSLFFPLFLLLAMDMIVSHALLQQRSGDKRAWPSAMVSPIELNRGRGVTDADVAEVT